jgi:hypothetical protein
VSNIQKRNKAEHPFMKVICLANHQATIFPPLGDEAGQYAALCGFLSRLTILYRGRGNVKGRDSGQQQQSLCSNTISQSNMTSQILS